MTKYSYIPSNKNSFENNFSGIEVIFDCGDDNSIDDLIEQFKSFLGAMGFSFNLVDDIVLDYDQLIKRAENGEIKIIENNKDSKEEAEG